MFQSNPIKQIFDEWYTKKSSWQDIQEIIPRDETIWEAFMLDPVYPSPDCLTELGFIVEWGNEVLFTQQRREDAAVVSNFPFTRKR
jgi:hypothetical protein